MPDHGGCAWLDMMRYDQCIPATEVDVHKLEKVIAGTATQQERMVKFVRKTAEPSQPAMDRWESFGCIVAFFAEPL